MYHMPLGVGLSEDSDGEYVKTSVPWKRTHGAGGRWINTDDHMHNKNLAASKNRVPLVANV